MDPLARANILLAIAYAGLDALDSDLLSLDGDEAVAELVARCLTGAAALAGVEVPE